MVKFKVKDPEGWVAFGWRNLETGIDCYKFPGISSDQYQIVPSYLKIFIERIVHICEL